MTQTAHRTGILVALFSLLALGCRDARLDTLALGISRDSALALMGTRPTRRMVYLARSHYVETLYFDRAGADSGTPLRKLSPVVLIDERVAGWGWKQLRGIAAEHQIVLPAN